MEKAFSKTILLADDEPDLRKTVSKLIQLQGHRVLEVADGAEAIQTIGSGVPLDLLILDLMMPKLSGYEVLLQLRHSENRDLPIIILTAKSSQSDIVQGYDKGAIFYLTKPFNTQTLLHAIDYLIGDPSWERLEMLESELLTSDGVIFCLRNSEPC